MIEYMLVVCLLVMVLEPKSGVLFELRKHLNPVGGTKQLIQGSEEGCAFGTSLFINFSGK